MCREINLVPFKDFYINCEVNNRLSIITSFESSFKALAYMNYYKYFMDNVSLNNKDADFLAINTMNEFDETLYSNSDFVEYKFQDKINFVNEICNYTLNGGIMLTGVDLYNWIPGSLLWQKHHVGHYSLITGYDKDKSVFICFDDDETGYNKHEIPVERFTTAFLNSGLSPSCYIVNVSKNIKPFFMEKDKILFNATQIIDSIKEIKIDSLWEVDANYDNYFSFIDFFIGSVTRISNRQKGNLLLFKEMENANLMEESLYCELSNTAAKLFEGWQNIKNIFIKRSLSNKRNLNMNKLHSIAEDLLCIEKDMWNRLIND